MGRKGGKARLHTMTPEARSAVARLGGLKRALNASVKARKPRQKAAKGAGKAS